mmetsp:Transcript_84173/g.243045  ORF Transcript_84173/g.243045 Transcript_84173/m.243045 type:complete len:251 (-) Transcript_84173:51-803(-)
MGASSCNSMNNNSRGGRHKGFNGMPSNESYGPGNGGTEPGVARRRAMYCAVGTSSHCPSASPLVHFPSHKDHLLMRSIWHGRYQGNTTVMCEARPQEYLPSSTYVFHFDPLSSPSGTAKPCKAWRSANCSKSRLWSMVSKRKTTFRPTTRCQLNLVFGSPDLKYSRDTVGPAESGNSSQPRRFRSVEAKLSRAGAAMTTGRVQRETRPGLLARFSCVVLSKTGGVFELDSLVSRRSPCAGDSDCDRAPST